MKEDLEKELHMVDEELEYLFERLEQLIHKRRNIMERMKQSASKGQKERETFIKHSKKQ
ncbi:hypothetical protein [Thermosulfidibacter takaii]|uniref:hypothetical protein n=1 Tax=Thermosulfidibacter takaii TaxID=412593 RepID=UPI00130E6603|nr:hypothetical protein [Thermosulfidibacter takaii]